MNLVSLPLKVRPEVLIRQVSVRRWFALLIDFAIQLFGGLFGAIFGAMALSLFTGDHAHNASEMAETTWYGLEFGFLGCWFVLSFTNRFLLQATSGASIGKKLMNLQLVSIDIPLRRSTDRPRLQRMLFKRWFLSELSFWSGGLGYLFMIFHPEKKAFADWFFGTEVVWVFKQNVINQKGNRVEVPRVDSDVDDIQKAA